MTHEFKVKLHVHKKKAIFFTLKWREIDLISRCVLVN